MGDTCVRADAPTLIVLCAKHCSKSDRFLVARVPSKATRQDFSCQNPGLKLLLPRAGLQPSRSHQLADPCLPG